MRGVRWNAVAREWVAGENQIENEKKRGKKMFVRSWHCGSRYHVSSKACYRSMGTTGDPVLTPGISVIVS